MISPVRRRALRRRLLAWYDAGHRALPWRFPQRAADPYRVWLAEVMLQQTQVRTAIPYFERFVRRFPTLESLASAREEEVLALWGGLGYYARARNLHAASREALRVHGALPAAFDALLALPGFGPYTAGAVASIAFAIPAPAVDGNVARVLARVFLVRGDPSRSRARERIAALASELVVGRLARRPPSAERAAGRRDGRPGDLNQALMELGATTCGKPIPSCARCPIARLCAARIAGRELRVPPARRRPPRRGLVFACAVVRRGPRLLLARRPPGGLFGGLFALPSAEVAPGEDEREALRRTLLHDHGLDATVGTELAACERLLTHRVLTLRAFDCAIRGRVPPSSGLRFAAERELAAIGIPAAVRDLLRRSAVTSRIALTRGAPSV